MGIANPRPAMRCREERGIHATLKHHAAMLDILTADGMPRNAADTIAMSITKTRKARKKIWRFK